MSQTRGTKVIHMGTTTVRVRWNVLSLGATGDLPVWRPIHSVMARNSWAPVGWSGWRIALTRRSEKYPRQLTTPNTLSFENKCGMWSHKITEQMEAYKYAQDQKQCTRSIILAFLCLLKIRWSRLKWEILHREHKNNIFIHGPDRPHFTSPWPFRCVFPGHPWQTVS